MVEQVLCCNLPCKLLSDDEYRTRYRCISCNKDKYVHKRLGSSDGFQGQLGKIVQAQNGDLYYECGVCGKPVKYSDLWERDAPGRNHIRQSRAAQRVTVLVKWEQKEIPYWYTTTTWRDDGKQDRGLGQGIKIVNVPILKSVAACASCYDVFERNRPSKIDEGTGQRVVDRQRLHFIQV